MEAFKNFDKDDPSHVKAVLNWGKYFGYKNMSAEEIVKIVRKNDSKKKK